MDEHLRVGEERRAPLCIDLQRQADTYRVTVVGAVDIASVPALEAAIRQGEDLKRHGWWSTCAV